jgi:hypothetical protein
MKTLLQKASRVSNAVATTSFFSPRCIRCEAPAKFFLCDAMGLPLEPQQGGFCARCAPAQERDGTDVTALYLGEPACLEVVEMTSDHCFEAIEAHAEHMENLRTERKWLRIDLALMENCADDATGNGPTFEEIEDTKVRLAELDELLILDDESVVCCTSQDVELVA